jgi:ATP phosphoribosyltransferase
MLERDRIRIGIQKSGRLSEKSLDLLNRCGLSFESSKDKLLSRCNNYPLDVMLLRDDDIPEYVNDGVCDLGIVGFNMLEEKLLRRYDKSSDGVTTLSKLGFGTCRLSIAVPNDFNYTDPRDLNNLRIATSYPKSLTRFLREKEINAKIVEISGSVEIAPALKIADAVCDLVSTGSTLRSNGLKEVDTLLKSESVMVQSKLEMTKQKQTDIARLLQRVQGVISAKQTKYIMMNAPKTALERIKSLLPGLENPSIMPLSGDDDNIAIHAVSSETIFWETMENLKAAGANGILVLPIEKIIW